MKTEIIDSNTLDPFKRPYTNPPKLCEVLVKEFNINKKNDGKLIEFLDGASNNKYKIFLNNKQVLDLIQSLQNSLNYCEKVNIDFVNQNKTERRHRLYLNNNQLIANFPLKHNINKELFLFKKCYNVKAHSNSCGGCDRYNGHIMLTFYIKDQNDVPVNLLKEGYSKPIFLDVFLTEEDSKNLFKELNKG